MVKRRLGLRMKTSIIVAKHLTELRGEKKNDCALEEVSLVTGFLLEMPCCTKQRAEKVSIRTVVLTALRDSERRQMLNSINSGASLAFVQADQGRRDNKEVAGNFPPLLDQVKSRSLFKTHVVSVTDRHRNLTCG